jgi:hypothetical protein
MNYGYLVKTEIRQSLDNEGDAGIDLTELWRRSEENLRG